MAISTAGERHALVGRRTELQQLQQGFLRASSGRGELFLIFGDAGIGKTRLVTDWLADIASRGTCTGVGECLDYAQAPYAPFVDALRAAPDALRNAVAVRSILSPLMPELSGVTSQRDVQGSKRRLFDAYAEALRTISAAKPLAIVIEDLHWADPDSLDLAVYLSGAIAATRVAMVFTYRQDEPQSRNFSAALARLERRPAVRRIPVGPLSAVEMRSFARTVTLQREMSPRTIDRVLTLAEGNPLFAEELLRAGDDMRSVSPNLRTLVLERLAPLTGEQRVVLVNASVIGLRFEPKLLQAAVGTPMEHVLAALRGARECHLITEQVDPTVYRFRHALIREILYHEILEPEAAAIHARVARAIERLPEAEIDPVSLAYHYWMARDVPKATAYAERAGDGSSRSLSFGEAATYYERALAGTPHLARLDRARLFEKLGAALFSAGLVERSLRSYALALDALGEESDAERRAALYGSMSKAELLLGHQDAAMRSVERGLAVLTSLESPIRFRLLLERLYLATVLEDEREVASILAEAEGFSGPRDSALDARFYQLRSYARAMLGDLERAEADLNLAIATATSAGDAELLYDALHTGFIIYGEASEYERSFAMLERAVAVADEALLLDKSIKARYMRAELIMDESLPIARAAVDAALAVPGLWDMHLMASAVTASAVRIALHQGDAAFLEHVANLALLEDGLRVGGHYAWRCGAALAELAIAKGDIARAQAVIHQVISHTTVGNGPVDRLLFAARVGHDRDLVRLVEYCREWTERHPTPFGPAVMALFESYRARARGENDRAKRLAAEAAEGFEKNGDSTALQALALEQLGRYREAAELYRRVGALGDVARLDAEHAPRGRRNRRASALSDREREVAELVAGGKTNKAIANLLAISERTVENHVTSIFKKTGVSTRAEFIARSLRETSPSSPSP